jgi:MOSC domain-containing protein YiiM
MQGRIFQLNVSPGGVPKLAVREAMLTGTGLVHDVQEHPNIHGGPERALCLYSLERILELQHEGHPIFPGAVGENVTVMGIDWASVEPGVRLALGDDVVIEIASYTSPCDSVAASFGDGRFVRISQKVNPGWSRVYARVLQTGRLHTGQAVHVVDDGAPKGA